MVDVRLWDYTREQIRDMAEQLTLIMPVASTEQHGPHLSVGVDSLVVEWVAGEAAKRASTLSDRPFLVAPVLPVGSSHHHLPFAGTLSVSSETLLHVLKEMGASAVRWGCRHLFFLNGHGGNEDVTHQAVRDLVLAHDIVAGAASYWTLAWDRLTADPLTSQIGRVPGHAGAFETSLMLALYPDLIDQQRYTHEPHHMGSYSARHPLAGPVIDRHQSFHRMNGYTDDARTASREAGTQFLAHIVESVADLFVRFSEDGLQGP